MVMLTAEKIQENWETLLNIIENEISGDRGSRLLEFYSQYSERLIMMPAAHKKEYHNSFPGGYVDHVIRVINCAIELHNLWEKMGADSSTYTREELIFSALNHDLGKMGDEEHEAYIPQTDQWRKDKLGEDYMFNTKVSFASVPDRGLYLLQSHGIQYTFNEMITIQTHDGLYDEANKKYLMTYLPEQKPRTSLPYIVHQADLMAARIEFEQEWLPKLNSDQPTKKTNFNLSKSDSSKKQPTKQKALSNVKSEGLKGLMDDFFN
jgi:hypothetical protein